MIVYSISNKMEGIKMIGSILITAVIVAYSGYILFKATKKKVKGDCCSTHMETGKRKGRG